MSVVENTCLAYFSFVVRRKIDVFRLDLKHFACTNTLPMLRFCQDCVKIIPE